MTNVLALIYIVLVVAAMVMNRVDSRRVPGANAITGGDLEAFAIFVGLALAALVLL